MRTKFLIYSLLVMVSCANIKDPPIQGNQPFYYSEYCNLTPTVTGDKTFFRSTLSTDIDTYCWIIQNKHSVYLMEYDSVDQLKADTFSIRESMYYTSGDFSTYMVFNGKVNEVKIRRESTQEGVSLLVFSIEDNVFGIPENYIQKNLDYLKSQK